MKETKKEGITLVALVITIIILLILAGIAIAGLGGENGLIAKVNKAKQAQIKAEMKEDLILAITELQTEKEGKATLDDITQEWANSALEGYNSTVTSDASISGKKITMQKSNVTVKYIIDENLNAIEIQENINSIEFWYEAKERIDNKVKIIIHVQDEENGLNKIEFPDQDAIIITTNKKEENVIDYQVEIGKENKIKITSESGEEKEETILIEEYCYKITKNLGEGIEIENQAIKAAYNKQYQATLTTGDDYIIESLTVTMGGQTVTTQGNNIVDITTGKINIEKVTGDIEITATAKKLEIQISEVYINTTQNATSSAATNSVDKSQYKLYVSFTAKLEGQNCTIEPPLTQLIEKNGKYTYTVTGTYQGKTITTTKEVKVDQYKSAQGLVQYSAGDWTESEIQSLKTVGLYNLNASCTANATAGLNFTFGGFTNKESSDATNSNIVTSKDKSVQIGHNNCIPKYDGWQILEIKDSSGNIIKKETEVKAKLANADTERIYVTKLVHAGCPENFVYYYTNAYDNRRVEYILSSGLRQKDYNTYSPRSWQMYIDESQKDMIADTKDKDGKTIKDIHAMTYEEALDITGNVDDTAGIRNTGSCYWLGSSYTNRDYYVWYVLYYENSSYGYLSPYAHSLCYGVRPVVSLESGVYIKSGDGTEESPYVLGIE